MTIKSRSNVIAAMFALLLPAPLLASDLPMLTSVSIQVQPRVATIFPGQMLSLEVNTEGVNGLGVQTPLSVAGVPNGTSVEVTPLTEQRATVNLVFPRSARAGTYVLLVQVGSPMPLVEQKIELLIRE